jgi:transcriptional regulator with XRE-family HTH domain
MEDRKHEPLRFPGDRDKLIARAVSADDDSVSVGGLAAKLGMLSEVPAAEGRPASPEAFGLQTLARFIQLSRREHGLTSEQFATKYDVDVRELLDIEDARGVPEPRVLYQVSQALGVSYDKLLVLAGHRRSRDERLDREVLRFAASSGPMDRLSKSELQALQDFIRVLHD